MPEIRKAKKTITLKDLVLHLGLSKATISLALNDSPLVADATKARVVKAAKELGYRPNYFASRLSRGKAEMIGLYMMGEDKPSSNWTQPSNWMFYNQILAGVTAPLAKNGYRLRLELITAREAIKGEVLANAIQEGSLDGILLIVQYDIDYSFLDIVEETQFPMVILNGGFRRNISSAKVDNELGARKIVNYLVEQGHTKIAHIAGPLEDLNAQERKAGFIASLSSAGLPLRENYIKVGDWQIESGRKLAAEIMYENKDVTAIFCANDHMAVGAMQTLKRLGIRIPKDVSIIGFDNSDLCEITAPQLSSVKQPLGKVGELSAQGVLNQIKGRAMSPTHTKLEPELVIRESTSYCPDAAGSAVGASSLRE